MQYERNDHFLKVFMQIAYRFVVLAVVVVVIFVLGACGGRDLEPVADGERTPVPESNEESDTVDSSEPEASTEEPAASPPAEPTTSPPIAVLSVEEAREIAQVWLDEHPVREPDLIDKEEHEDVDHDGDSYFRFFHIEPMMYWFSILVNVESGELLVMLTEDGMEPGPPVIEPLDEWYYWNFEFDDDVDDVGPHYYNAVMSGAAWIEITIIWEDGRKTIFTRDTDREWVMTSRDGGASIVYPDFSHSGSTNEIRFPTTSRVYYLYDDFTGVFGNERFRWDYDVRG